MADKKNNFQQLMDDDYEPRFTLPQMTEIEQRLKRRHESYRLAGDVLDLFFPKIIRTVVGMLGGDDNDDDNNNIPNRSAPSDFGGHISPKEPKAPGGR